MTLSQLTELLGWASILNIGYLMLSTFVLIFMKKSITSLHSKLFDLEQKDLPLSYFNFVANYKIFTLIFIVSPYLALKIMGQ